MATNWLKQTDVPSFPDIIWNRPHNQRQIGSILLIAGTAQNLAPINKAYEALRKIDVQNIYLVAPQSAEPVIGGFIDGSFVEETPSHSLAKSSQGIVESLLSNHSLTLMPGDIGSNTETLSLFEGLLKHSGWVGLSNQTVLELMYAIKSILNRDQTIVEVDIKTLQRIGTELKLDYAFERNGDLVATVEKLKTLSKSCEAIIILHFKNSIISAVNGEICQTIGVKPSLIEAALFATWNDATFSAIASGVFVAQNGIKD